MPEFKRYQWSDEFFKVFEKSLNDDAQTLKHQVLNERAQVIRVLDDGVDLWTILRRERRQDGDELVFCCVEGTGLKKGYLLIEQWAKSLGMVTSRFHSLRGGLARMCDGYNVAEIVYRKEL
ncbi:hypothetical protein P8629_07015 [Hydrogenovibrio sp. 3SP14C1]|uniref:hypothetical protein n=1 Tax=Hydrogenovibrio sp. 3SP14C1 TaxID=3038774 RepID=UPI002415A4B4|nr:hypothetical protein [Hydrogenovibrio sp. 3SP14C1]MDG4812756.1 hypothetical protein [Hydrogenovibrio sp. 3SP14C1]